MGEFDHVSPDTPSENAPTNRASWINKASTMMERFYSQEESGRRGKGGQNLKDSDTWVKVQNLVEYGDTPVPIDLLRGHVVQLDNYLLDDLDHRHLWFEGKLYSSAVKGRFGIVRQAVESDEIVKAQLIGVCTAMINVAGGDHRFASPEHGEYILKSASSGPVEILSPVAANQGDLTTRTDANTGTVTMDSGSHTIETGDTVNVYWAGGERKGMTVGTVSGTTVPIDGGSGDDLPVADTEVYVSPEGGQELAVLIGGGAAAQFVAIVDDIDGATWDGSEVTEQDLTVYPFDGKAPSESGSFTVRVGLGVETPQTITAGKFKRGIILGDILLQVQCPEWDLPEGWGE